MISDEIRDQLKLLEPDLTALTTFWKNAPHESRFHELSTIMNQENFWEHPERVAIAQEMRQLKILKQSYDSVTEKFSEITEFLDLFGSDESEIESLKSEIAPLKKAVKALKIKLLLDEPSDSSNCFVTINPGAGGTESQDWAEILLRMYMRFCERENFTVKTLDLQNGEEAGIKSATLMVSGPYAYGLLKAEIGIHRLVRISPFDSNKRRHTSFASVGVTPEVAEATIEINDKDLRIDTYRAGGAGGQHVNKTDSAVRITHIPSGIVVQCQNERSQMQNKQTALKMLYARLVQKREQEKRDADNAQTKLKIEWGSQIRSYVLHPYKMVKDVRTGHESSQPDTVLDGDIMAFIESFLLQ